MATRYACTGASPSPLAICGFPPASNFTFDPFPFFPSLRGSRAGVPSCLRALFELAFISPAARISVVSAFSSIGSPSWKSIARRVLPSRLELKRPAGSASAAPLAKVIFTAFLYVSPVQIIPSCDQTGTPAGLEGFFHFISSIASGSASRIRVRMLASVLTRQSLWDGEASPFAFFKPLLMFFMDVVAFFMAVVPRIGRLHSYARQLAGLLHPTGES